MLDDLGLLPTLLWLFERYTAQTQVEVDFEHRGLEGRFPPDAETAAYRIMQEALTNVARHAGVGECRVGLWLDDRGVLSIRVEDRGAGFDPASARGASTGLSGMEERAMLLGGVLWVESAPGAGTRVVAELPVRPSDSRGDTGP
jgi:signal transduction histidine kinase